MTSWWSNAQKCYCILPQNKCAPYILTMTINTRTSVSSYDVILWQNILLWGEGQISLLLTHLHHLSRLVSVERWGVRHAGDLYGHTCRKVSPEPPQATDWGYKMTRSENIYLVLKTTQQKFVLKDRDNARFFSLCFGLRECILSYFYSKNGHNSRENYHIRTKFKLVLMTTYKVSLNSLKHQDNARFPSWLLASENVFLSYIYSKGAITQ